MFSEKIEIALIKEKTSKTELARRLNSSAQALYEKMKKDNFTEKQMIEFVKALDGELVLKIKLKDGTEI